MTDSVSGWRDIESAPKDGTRILVYQPEGAWSGNRVRKNRRAWVDVAYWHQPGNPQVDGYWQANAGMESLLRPSHWMPLPDPPALSVVSAVPREEKDQKDHARCVEHQQGISGPDQRGDEGGDS